MLTPGIHKAYQTGVARLAGHKAVEMVAEGKPANGPTQGQAALFITGSEAFAQHVDLEEEVFGAASLVIRCPDVDDADTGRETGRPAHCHHPDGRWRRGGRARTAADARAQVGRIW
jgi:hypothetical protein